VHRANIAWRIPSRADSDDHHILVEDIPEFEELAEHQGHTFLHTPIRIGVILSGTATDGTCFFIIDRLLLDRHGRGKESSAENFLTRPWISE
jgi:hypothetical protein